MAVWEPETYPIADGNHKAQHLEAAIDLANNRGRIMRMLTLSDILDDLQTADQALRRFEQRYWISTKQFYGLYSQGMLDTGDHAEDFAEWAGFYKLQQKREGALEQLSQQRLTYLRSQATTDLLDLAPAEPALEVTA